MRSGNETTFCRPDPNFLSRIVLLTVCIPTTTTKVMFSRGRVSSLKYESVRFDFKAVVFILRANPGKEETTDGSDSHEFYSETVHFSGSGKS